MLAELFARYGTDKAVSGYHNVYEPLFFHIRERVGTLLEVGIGTMIRGARSSMVGYAQDGYKPGGSLRAWRDFCPNSHVYGLDVQQDCLFEEPRITTALCDSTDGKALSEQLNKWGQSFDIVIDDGDHRGDAQEATFNNLWPWVRGGGYYVVEDCGEAAERLLALVKGHQYTSGWPVFVNNAKNLLVALRPPTAETRISIVTPAQCFDCGIVRPSCFPFVSIDFRNLGPRLLCSWCAWMRGCAGDDAVLRWQHEETEWAWAMRRRGHVKDGQPR